MTHIERAEKIWKIVYDAFERTAGDVAKTVWAAKGQANDVQFSLMAHIAEYKKTGSDESLEQVLADCGVAHMTGMFTDETYEKIEKLVGDA